MLKLLLCTAIISPCFIIPLSKISANTSLTSYTAPSFEDVFVEPELQRLENCQSAKLDVFFHDEYVTLHTAEYLAQAVKLAKSCDNADYVINPIVPELQIGVTTDLLEAQVQELSLILKAHGIESRIADPQIQTEFNSLSVNGRTAILSIAISEGNSA